MIPKCPICGSRYITIERENMYLVLTCKEHPEHVTKKPYCPSCYHETMRTTKEGRICINCGKVTPKEVKFNG